MRKLFSILLLTLLLLPDVSNTFSSLFGHVHEVCTKDGIHYHDHENECITCVISANNYSVLINSLKFSTKNIFINESLVNYLEGGYHNQSKLNISSRAPPVII